MMYQLFRFAWAVVIAQCSALIAVSVLDFTAFGVLFTVGCAAAGFNAGLHIARIVWPEGTGRG